MQQYRYNINHIHPVTDTLLQIFVSPESESIHYLAGQYVDIYCEGEGRPFSIANAALGSSELEFHIRHTPDNDFANNLVKAIRRDGFLDISEGCGHCTLQNGSEGPIILVAGGTGIAPMKALIEDLLSQECMRRVELYWGVREAKDLYLHESLLAWGNSIQLLEYYPIIEMPASDWGGLKGVPYEYIEQLHKHFEDYEAYVAGPEPFVHEVLRVMLAKGLFRVNFYSDMI